MTAAENDRRPRVVEEWGIRFRDAEAGTIREVTFSQEYAMRYLGDEGIDVVRRERIVTPDIVRPWRVVPPASTGGAS